MIKHTNRKRSTVIVWCMHARDSQHNNIVNANKCVTVDVDGFL